MAYQDTMVYAALSQLTRSLIASIGPISHPDPEISDFLNWNILYIEDQAGTGFQKILYDIVFSTFWAGFSCSEPLFDLHNGKLILDNVVTYHPSTLTIVPDKQGMLRENRPTWDNYRKSGIYQNPSYMMSEAKLPLWKTIYIAHNSTFSNYYGQSVIAPLYRWFRVKEVLVDMMVTALDRFGNPLLYIKAPAHPTGETVLENGEERQITTFDLLQEQINNLSGGGNVLLLPQNDGANKPDIGALTTGNNIGQTFYDSIQYCNEQMILSTGFPFFLISNEIKGTGSAVERRMETFYSTLEYLRIQILRPIARQAFHRLIQYNFNRESAKITPEFTRIYSDRPEDRVASMQMIQGLTELGYFNPKNSLDFEMVRQMVRAADRRLDNKDKEFIDLLFEKQTQGEGGGRPIGSSKPQQVARPKTQKKPEGQVKRAA
ncbi:phage portal protein family protein [Leptolyngbya sp. AN03gr2]|uniref:phage portal protein family protein n=1 Tax=Leptolyngbya sp. AN03gr2 TaxID=3423364 RepID=UPI003D31A53D